MEDNSKLIAEFMIGSYNPKQCSNYMNWENLISIVEKIENTDCSKNSYKWIDPHQKERFNFSYPEVLIQGTNCYIGFECQLDPFLELCDITESTKQEAVYKACVKFIKWYNGRKIN